MTDYGTSYRSTTTTYSEPSATRQGLGISDDTPGSLARVRTQGNRSNYSTSGSNYGSATNQNQSATQARRIDGSGNYGNAMRNHVDVSATEVPGSRRQTVGNRVRVASSNTQQGIRNTVKGALRAASTVGSVAKGVSGAIGSRVLPGIGINAKGEIDFGLRVASTGVSISASGNVSISVPGITLTVNPRNPNDFGYDYGFGLWTIESSQVGCDIIITTSFRGQVIGQQTRRADECREPEPEPEPTPDPSPNPDPGAIPDPPGFGNSYTPKQPPPCYTGYIYKYIYGSRSEVEQIQTYTVGNETFTSRQSLYVYGKGSDLGFGMVPDEIISSPSLGGLVAKEKYQYKNRGSFTHPITGIVYDDPRFQRIETRHDYIICVNPGSLFGDDWINGILAKEVIAPPNCSPYNNKPRSLPPMDDKCDCELLGKIYDMLGGDTFYENGLTIPNQLFIPDGKGSFKMKTYNEIMNIIFRTFSHRTPGEIEFTIEDANKGKEGNQKVHIRTINAQGYYTMLLKSISNLGYENTDQMNLLVRLGVVTSQLMKLAVIVNQNLKNVLSFFDMPTKDTLENVDIPFDMSLKGKLNRGFDSRADLQKELLKIVDEDTEQAIEGILDKFLNEWQMPVKVQKLRSTKEGGNFWYFLKQLRN